MNEENHLKPLPKWRAILATVPLSFAYILTAIIVGNSWMVFFLIQNACLALYKNGASRSKAKEIVCDIVDMVYEASGYEE